MGEYDNISFDDFKLIWECRSETCTLSHMVVDTFTFKIDHCIMWAIRLYRIDILKYLLSKNEHKTSYTRTSLLENVIRLFVEDKQTHLIQILLEAGIEPNKDIRHISSEQGKPVCRTNNTFFIYELVPRIHSRSLELLFLYGFDVNTRSLANNILTITLYDFYKAHGIDNLNADDQNNPVFSQFQERVRIIMEYGIKMNETIAILQRMYPSEDLIREVPLLFKKYQKLRNKRLRELLK